MAKRTPEKEQMEAEANYFAMCLLMPYEFMKKDLEELGEIDVCDDPKIRKLAKKYQVTEQLMMIRIGQVTKQMGVKW